MYLLSYLKFNIENDLGENLTGTDFYSTNSVLILNRFIKLLSLS